jgi:hypothetical protein
MTKYELSRRDALAALGTVGAGVGAATLTWDSLGDAPDERTAQVTDHDRRLLEAIAEAIYPSAVSNVPTFVETYVVGQVQDEPERMAGIAAGVRYVDTYAKEWYDTPYLDLPTQRQQTALKAMGAAAADPDPDGGDLGRLRFYVINELLYALYASPTGAELLELENPQGYPGGTDSYQHGPPE